MSDTAGELARVLRALLGQIEEGVLEATAAQQAYLAGALHVAEQLAEQTQDGPTAS